MALPAPGHNVPDQSGHSPGPLNRRILVVDDNQAIHRDFIKILCSKRSDGELSHYESLLFPEEASKGQATGQDLSGYEVDCALQGEQALELVRAAVREERPYAVAFIDMVMPPGWDGITTIQQLWQTDPRLEIVICTAYTGQDWNAVTELMGERDQLLFLVKPFDRREVDQLARTLTRKWELRRDAERNLSNLSAEATERAAALEQATAELAHQQRERQELTQSVEELRLLNAELARVNNELESFTYSVSHDLKAPLRGIEGYSTLLQERYADKLDDKGLRFLAMMRSATRQMGQLIDDMLAYSRLERSPFTSSELDPYALIQALVEERSKEIAERGALLRIDIPCPSMIGDRNGLTVALRNLLENALKFTRNIASPVIEFGGRETESSWILWVRDNGCGFDMQYHDRIFELFQRLHRVEDYPGTGVGLALVRKAMQRMGGRVWAESQLDAGATFYLEVPRPT